MWMTSGRVILATAVGFAHQTIAYAPLNPRCATTRAIPCTKPLSSLTPLPYKSSVTGLYSYQDTNPRSISSLSPLFSSESESEEPNEPVPEKKSFLGKAMDMIKPKSSEKLSTKETLKKMGLSVLLSYGFVSNMTYCVITGLSWFTFSKKTGLSPLAPGEWKKFLAVYAGFYVFANIIRPFRIGLSVAISKYFDSALEQIQKKANVSKGVAIGILMFMANVVVNCAVMAFGIFLASMFSGVPIFPGKA